MADLADRIRAAREQWVTAGGKEWLLRRPTRLQLSALAGDPGEIVFASIVGWKITEADLVPGGGDRIPPFDAEAFREYASDHPSLLNELSEHVLRAIEAHNAKLESIEKN